LRKFVFIDRCLQNTNQTKKNNKDGSEFKASDAIYTASFTDAFSDVGSILLITVNGHEWCSAWFT